MPFRPKLVDALKGYSYQTFHADLLAGVTVGIIALSLSMALGIASQRTPGVGIYTAVIAGFLVSALGGSRVQIGGPTAAFIPVVVGVMVAYGADNLIICTAMAGLMLVAMGAARLGTMIKYIPVPVIMGFTAGISVYILSTQVRDFLGLTGQQAVPAEFIPKVRFMLENIGSLHWPAIGLSAASLALIRYWPGRWGRWVPGSIIAVIVGTVVVYVLKIPVEPIGSRFGVDAIPARFPMPHWPRFDWEQVQHLFRPAFTIALLAAIESLLCAVVADGMIEDRHDSNTELMAQGVPNVGSAIFGGLAATGVLARTAANVRSGARTPMAGIIHSITILAIVLTAAPMAGFVPLPVLSAVLVVVALNMGEWHNFARLSRWPKGDAAVYLATFILTVLAAVLFIKRVSETT